MCDEAEARRRSPCGCRPQCSRRRSRRRGPPNRRSTLDHLDAVLGRAITGERVSQPTYSASGATAWSTECRSPHASRVVVVHDLVEHPDGRDARILGRLRVALRAAARDQERHQHERRDESAHRVLTPARSAARRARPRARASRRQADRRTARPVLIRDPEPDPVGDLEARLLAQHVHRVDRGRTGGPRAAGRRRAPCRSRP